MALESDEQQMVADIARLYRQLEEAVATVAQLTQRLATLPVTVYRQFTCEIIIIIHTFVRHFHFLVLHQKVLACSTIWNI